jgi:hypothetical protein
MRQSRLNFLCLGRASDNSLGRRAVASNAISFLCHCISIALGIRRIGPVVLIVLVFLSSTLLGQTSADVSLGLDLLQKSCDRISTASSFVCEITDNIARQTTPYFSRTFPDGVVEVATVLSVKPFRVGIKNRGGYWIESDDEVVNVQYQSSQRPQKAVLDIQRNNPAEVTVKIKNQATQDVDCRLVEADLSDRLTRQLADSFRTEHKSSQALRQDPKMDMLQFIAKRRLFWIGVADQLLYEYKEYDGNGDLFRDISLSNQRFNEMIPDGVFLVSTNLKIFTAFTPQDLEKHQAARAREQRVAAWQNLFRTESDKGLSRGSRFQTNNP